jgi:uncharacterized protein (DUF58 family)
MLFFKNSSKTDNDKKGLCVSVEELIEQQRYLPYLSLKNNVTTNKSGDVKSPFKGRGIEMEEVREYIFGDDIRDINWRITARKNEPYTNVYSEEKDRQIIVVLDFSSSMIFGTRNELKSVCVAKVAALLGWMSIKNKDRFGVLIYDGNNTTYLKPQNNHKNLMAIFQSIAKHSCEALTDSKIGDISEALKFLEFHQKGEGSIFILSDFHNFDENGFRKISALSKRNKIYCVNIFDVIEDIAPVNGEYKAQFDGKEVLFSTDAEKFKDIYKEYFSQHRENFRKNCQKFSCRYLEIRTDLPIFKQLQLI